MNEELKDKIDEPVPAIEMSMEEIATTTRAAKSAQMRLTDAVNDRARLHMYGQNEVRLRIWRGR
jgi:hypothetical protein